MENNIKLPELIDCNSEPMIKDLIDSLNFSRNILASTDEIEVIWGNLPLEINSIKSEYRHEMLARMVIAIRVGLFSSAVNEIWNITILALRQKINNFGLDVANQFLKRSLDNNKFKELKDKELIDISMELGLLDDNAYFFLK